MQRPNRRRFLRSALAGTATLAAASLFPKPGSAEPCLVIGGGPAGVSAALALRAARPGLPVTLVERDPTRLAAPAAEIAAFLRPAPPADVADLAAAGVSVVLDDVTEVDWASRRLGLFSGRRIAFGSLVMAPGVAPRDEAIAGYDAIARHVWPAAWGSPREARRLSGQLAAMADDGHVVLRLPEGAGGHPAVAAERALTIADFLHRTRPSARLTVLDAAPDSEAARIFAARLPVGGAAARVDWRNAAAGGRVFAVDASRGILETGAGTLRADVVNFVVPQGAAAVARLAGLVDDSGWCPCDAGARSLLNPDAIVIGDVRRNATRDLPGALAQGTLGARAVLAS
ncbi:FAD-dependent oxidoreductase [Tropicimonas sp. IMCC34043]|uniref:FAD-dependent oxidoreductase n=1 Tax=Tropicimonas sp. IMCC34043 TaxID=2248760 RepID=UPI000E2756F6|nr:FAD-dependent oxidoreductase [Tropicimonas sp. IMCC34043]